MIEILLAYWSIIGSIFCVIYMTATNQLEGSGSKCWEEVIPNKIKRTGFIFILGPVVIFFYVIINFFAWLRK